MRWPSVKRAWTSISGGDDHADAAHSVAYPAADQDATARGPPVARAGPLGLVFTYSCSYNLLLFAPSIYLLQIYDRVLSSRSGDTLLLLTLIVAITVVVGGVFDALRRAVLGRLGAWLDDRLRPCVLSAGLESAFAAIGRKRRARIGISRCSA